MTKRPWRETFFRHFVEELRHLDAVSGRILELGSGPGFLARRVLESLPLVEYTALDFSAAMHVLARERLGSLAQRVQFVESDFSVPDWTASLSSYHAVLTVQAVHELRHKRHAAGFYRSVAQRLLPGGVLLVCDHVCGEDGMTNAALYMSLPEHQQALHESGFAAVHEVHRERGLVLYRAHLERQ
jgi:SAM-dependent methyltransferase